MTVDPEGNPVIALKAAAEIGVDVAQVALIQGLPVERVSQAQMVVGAVIAGGQHAAVHTGIIFRRTSVGQGYSGFTARHQKGGSHQNGETCKA